MQSQSAAHLTLSLCIRPWMPRLIGSGIESELPMFPLFILWQRWMDQTRDAWDDIGGITLQVIRRVGNWRRESESSSTSGITRGHFAHLSSWAPLSAKERNGKKLLYWCSSKLQVLTVGVFILTILISSTLLEGQRCSTWSDHMRTPDQEQWTRG